MNKNLSPKNILVVKNRAMGDAIIGLYAIKALEEEFKGANLYYAVPFWMVDLFKKLHPDFKDVFGLKFKNLYEWFQTYQLISKNNFDLIIEFNQTSRSGKFFKFYSKLKTIPYFFHNHNPTIKNFVIDQGIRKPNIQKDLDLISTYFREQKSMKSFDFKKYLLSIKKNKSKKIILGVVATRITKMWPLENVIEFIGIVKKEFPDYQIFVPISNNDQDQNIKKSLEKNLAMGLVKFVESTLSDLVTLFEDAELYVGNDTGIKHLAVYLNIPTITFFGPEEPFEWHPYDKNDHHFFYITPLECRTKTSYFCGLDTCEVMACLRPITATSVMEKVRELLLYQ